MFTGPNRALAFSKGPSRHFPLPGPHRPSLLALPFLSPPLLTFQEAARS